MGQMKQQDGEKSCYWELLRTALASVIPKASLKSAILAET